MLESSLVPSSSTVSAQFEFFTCLITIQKHCSGPLEGLDKIAIITQLSGLEMAQRDHQETLSSSNSNDFTIYDVAKRSMKGSQDKVAALLSLTCIFKI